MTCIVYIVSHPDLTFLKIGCWSGYLDSLKSTYQTYYGDKLQLIVFDCENMNYESKLHQDLCKYAIEEERYKYEHYQSCYDYCVKNFGRARTFDEPITTSKYYCESCQFTTRDKSEYRKHIDSDKHKLKKELKDLHSEKAQLKLEKTLQTELQKSLTISIVVPDRTCMQCGLTFNSVNEYSEHLLTDNHIQLQAFLREQKYLSDIDCMNKRIRDLIKENENLKQEIDSLECQLDNKDKAQMKRLIEERVLTERCANLRDERDHLREVNKKPLTINQTNYKTINKILNMISPEVIDYSQVRELLTASLASKGPEVVATTIHDRLLMDGNGKPKVVCTDPSRNKYKIKDPETGEIIDDPNLEQVKSNINEQMEFKSVKADCLKVAELEANGDECSAYVARQYMKSLKLNGITGRMLNKKLRLHYIPTAKLKFDEPSEANNPTTE